MDYYSNDNSVMVYRYGFGRPYKTSVFVHIPTGLLFRAMNLECLASCAEKILEFEEIPGTERIENYD